MSRLHISIAGLMGLVLFAALAFAAMKHPSPLLASALYTLDAGLVCVAVAAAMSRRGAARRTWAGFAVFAGAYLALAFATFPVTAPSLLTTWGLSYLDAGRDMMAIATGDFVAVSYFQSPTGPSINFPALPLLQVCHCLAALLAGLLGAAVAMLVGRSDAASLP